MDKKISIPEKTVFLLQEKSRYKVLYGGRGSGKSVNVALCLIIIAIKRKVRILCTRQIQISIKDSVHKLLKDLIYQYGFESYFEITNETIRGVNGSEFIFKGLKSSIADIKSMQGIDYCWVEEAESVTAESWDVLIPTIREEGSEIWITFNPNMKSDETYQRFVVDPPKDCITVKLNYYDNPFFPEVLKNTMEACKELNFPKYEHIWLGIPNTEAGNLIKMSYFKRYNISPAVFEGLYIICDTAFSEKKSADNSAFMLVGISGKNKYILDIYAKKVGFVDLCRDLKSFYLKAMENYGKENTLSAIYIENKASGISLTQQLRSEGLPIMELYPTVHNQQLQKEVTADKYTRFLEIEADLCSGNVYIPDSAPWLPEFERECEAFTGGKQDEHDDIVDCLLYGLKVAKKYLQNDWNAFARAFS